MSQFNRRELLIGAVGAVGASISAKAWGQAIATRPAPAKHFSPSDTIVLGRSGIKTSRVAIGTGTTGGKQQRDMGPDGFNRMLRYGLDEGVRWWDTADRYNTHSLVAAALKEVPRDKVVITSKTWCRDKDAAYVKADLERFRKELNTDYIDIVLMHCLEDPKWPEKMKGQMDVLSEAKQKGIIRAHGVSCHSLGALEAAADEPWVDIDLARFNPYATLMDVKAPDEIHKVARALEKMHTQGKAVYGMKIIGEGAFKGDKIDISLRHALSKPYISGMTIGFTSTDQIDDIGRRMDRIRTA